MSTPRNQITEHDAAAMLKAFSKQVNEGRIFTVEELQPILAYAAALIARQHEEIQMLSREIQAMKTK
jgi:hypothetical protein